jgi:hypothetical protein
LAKSAPKTADQLVLDALEKALRVGHEFRLISVGKKPEGAGLFPDEKGARKTALEKSLYTDPAFLTVVRSEEAQVGKRKTVHRFVTVTTKGIEHLCSKLPAEKLGDLLIIAAERAKEEVRALQAKADKIVEARQRVLDNVNALAQQLAEATHRSQAAVNDAAQKATVLQSHLDSLPLPASLMPSAPTRTPLRRASTEEEARFRQRAAQQLVFAWQESTPEGREPIERALLNLGAEPIGRLGEHFEFAGRVHESREPMLPGDPVEILRPGWLLRDDSGGYLLGHAQVRAVQQKSGD